MNAKQKERLEEFYIGIHMLVNGHAIAKGEKQARIRILDFAIWASSAINFMIAEGTFSPLEKRECVTLMVNIHLQEMGIKMPKEHKDILISDMMERGEIVNDIAVIAHVIEQVR